MNITAFLADDHVIIREGLKAMLETQSWIKVIGEAGTGREVLEMAAESCPDLVVMDIAMPELNGIEATRRLFDLCPGIKVVILSIYSTTEHIHRAFKAGAKAYILKESAGRELIAAIRALQVNQRYLSDKIREAHPDIFEYLRRDISPLESLSQREMEVLQLAVEGKSSAAIATRMNLSPKTVETYRSRLMQKLGVSDLPSLIKFAIQNGITSL
ncbi:MAG: response regulator [Desulfobulbaceae bacterium]